MGGGGVWGVGVGVNIFTYIFGYLCEFTCLSVHVCAFCASTNDIRCVLSVHQPGLVVEICLQCCAPSSVRAPEETDVGICGIQSTVECAICQGIHLEADRGSSGCRHIGEPPLICCSCIALCVRECTETLTPPT